MKRNKVLLMGALASTSMALGAIAVLTSNNPSVGLAGACEHTHVEHYSKAADPDSTTIVEHWACCECHQAWADEARTVLLSENTTADRSKLDVNLGMSFATQWTTARTKLIYDETRGYTFRTMAKELGNGAYNCIETVGTPWTLNSATSLGYFGAVTNRTTAVIRVDVHRRAWGARSDSFYLGVGETKNFSVTVDDFNAETSGGNYGFALLCYNTAEQTAEGYIDITAPVYESAAPSLFNSIQNMTWTRYTPTYNATYGIEFDNPETIPEEVSKNRLIEGRKVIDAVHYGGVSFKVYNDSNTNITAGNVWSSDWGDYHSTHPAFPAHQWTEMTIPAYVWNGNGGAGSVEICDIEAIDGTLKFADFKLEPLYAFGAIGGEEITLQMPDGSWPAAAKVTTEKGKAFRMDWVAGLASMATNNRKPIDASLYNEVEFYVYNATDADMTCYSTCDWSESVHYDTFARNTWVRCTMGVAEYNKSGNMYFYPSTAATTGSLYMTYWVAK